MMTISEKNRSLIRKLVHDYSGILIERVTTRQLEKKVDEQMRHLGIIDQRDYIAIIEDYEHDSAPLEELVSELTVSESYFFRNPAQFEFIAKIFLPDLFALRGCDMPCKIWSAGCSRGEEAYSIAMMAKHFMATRPGARFSINAGDINTRNLHAAGEAVYGARSLRDKLESLETSLGFCPGIKDGAGEFSIARDLREMVSFQKLNLKNTQNLKCMMGSDIIFCRNVLIYFDDDLRTQLIDEFYKVLAPGGILLLGESECLPASSAHFDLLSHKNAYAYRKPYAIRQTDD
ncbi:MAG: protein-glutamate O-methyltransferase CheR [Candidatus Riflebacteria bacterium]|nr:protein-glutamate O-methyltransferase CheR [Candidatus Riflebacteria bacterium]